jgi:REP element-mobilizing transposase RayT
LEGKEAEPGLGAPRWHSRGYLPHLDDLTKLQSITFRLADSLPQNKLQQLERELTHLPEEAQALERRKRIEQWLDSGIGCCALKHPDVARVVQETLLHFDGDRYQLLAWCIMPNHVHVLIEPQAELGRIVQSWKSYTGRWAMGKNAELGLGVPGKSFWMREYWDRYIRDQNHFNAVVDYIHNNPVKAGLCRTPAEWPWSSGSAEPQLGSWKRNALSRRKPS